METLSGILQSFKITIIKAKKGLFTFNIYSVEKDQLNKLREIFELKGFKSTDEFESYKNTNSTIYFTCDKGHFCETKARYVLYGNSGCKTCQYEIKKSILNIDLKETEFKICNSCHEKKSRTKFGKLNSSVDGLRNTCKLCRRKKTSSESLEIKKERSAKSLKYFKNKPFRVMLSRCKSNHNKKGMIDFDLTEEFLSELYEKQKGKCFWSGIDLSIDNVGLSKLNSLSVDRIDSSIGYTKNNIVLCCKFYNLGKGNTDKDYFINFLIENGLKISDNLK